jgi:hypothetical protein
MAQIKFEKTCCSAADSSGLAQTLCCVSAVGCEGVEPIGGDAPLG